MRHGRSVSFDGGSSREGDHYEGDDEHRKARTVQHRRDIRAHQTPHAPSWLEIRADHGWMLQHGRGLTLGDDAPEVQGDQAI